MIQPCTAKDAAGFAPQKRCAILVQQSLPGGVILPPIKPLLIRLVRSATSDCKRKSKETIRSAKISGRQKHKLFRISEISEKPARQCPDAKAPAAGLDRRRPFWGYQVLTGGQVRGRRRNSGSRQHGANSTAKVKRKCSATLWKKPRRKQVAVASRKPLITF